MQKLMKQLLTSILFFLISFCSTAQDYYWIGGTGNWSDLTHWSATSGGSPDQAQLPTATNNVFFDANSFTVSSQIVTLDVEANCNSMNWSGVVNFPTITGNGNDINIYGSLELSPDMTADFSDVEFESTSTGNTITTNSTSLGASSISRFNGNGGGWSLTDNFTTNGIFIIAGSFVTNNNNVNSGQWFQTSSSLTKSIDLGSSIITSTRWWIFGSNITINAGTSKIITALFYGDVDGSGPHTYYDVEFNSGGSLRNNAIFNEITMAAGETHTLQSGDVFTINNLVANGTKHNSIIIKTTTPGSEATFSKATGAITVSYVELIDIHATGGANFTANNAIGNGNTTGWTINPVVEQNYYWVGNSGNWSDYTNHWATTSGGSTMHTDYPSKTDNVFFDTNSFTSGGQTVTLDLNAQIKDMDWTGVTNIPTITGAFAFRLDVFGSVTFTPEVNKNIWNFSLRGSGNHTITSSTNGAYLNFKIDGDGTYTFQDALSAQSISLYKGIINTNNQTITSSIDIVILGTANGTTVNLGSSDIYARNFNLSNYSYQPTLNAGTSNLYLSGGIVVQNNTISGFQFNNVHLNGTTTLEGSNTFENLTLQPGSSVSFEDNETTTINAGLNLNGTKALPISLGSTLLGTASTISMASGVVNGTYLVLQDITATGGATFNATQTIDNGNNTGWNITPITSLDYYWIGNGGNWSDFANHWATTSGGSTMHTDVPGVLDNVFFDANSFSLAGEVVTIDDSQVNFNDLDASAVSAAFTLSGNNKEMNIYGSVDFPAIVSSSVATYNFLATGSETLKFDNGPGISRDFNFLSAGSWTLNSNLLLDKLQLESGTLNTNNYDVLVDFQMRMDGTNAKTLTLGTSTLTVNSWYGSGLNNITVNGGTSAIIITGSFLLESDGTNSVTLNNLTFASTTGNLIYHDVTLNKCTIEAGNTLKTSGIVTITANEFVLTGTSTDPIVFEPQTTISKLTLSQPTGIVNGDYLHLQDISATGGATFNAYNSIDNGGVIGWVFHRSSQTITFNALPDKTFGDPDFDISATASSGLPVSLSIISGPATISGTTITLTGTGTVEVKAEQAGNIDYDPAPSVTNSFEVVKAEQTITFEPLSDIVLGEVNSIELVASSTSGLAIAFSVTGPATISGSTLTPTSAGMVVVTATQAGNETYLAATDVEQSFEITDNITGLEELKANNVQIYPQPAQNNLFIGQPNKGFDSIIIYDLNGMTVLENNSTENLIELDTSLLPNGIYFLRLIGKTKSFTTRIVVGK